MQVTLDMPAQAILSTFNAREVHFELRLKDTDIDHEIYAESQDVSMATKAPVNAFSLLKEGSRRQMLQGSPPTISGIPTPLPTPEFNVVNSKVQLEIDIFEIFDALGLAAPPHSHSYLRKMLKSVVNYMWYIDPHHQQLMRHSGPLPKSFRHLAFSCYNDFREKKQKAPPLSADKLEVHVNDLYSQLTIPVLKLTCNTGSLDALSALSDCAARQVAYMRADAASKRVRREQLVVNEGKIAMAYHPKMPGPFEREIDKKIIHALRALVCIRMCEKLGYGML